MTAELKMFYCSVCKLCALTSCAEEPACKKNPVESLMDFNARLLSHFILLDKNNKGIKAEPRLVG